MCGLSPWWLLHPTQSPLSFIFRHCHIHQQCKFCSSKSIEIGAHSSMGYWKCKYYKLFCQVISLKCCSYNINGDDRSEGSRLYQIVIQKMPTPGYQKEPFLSSSYEETGRWWWWQRLRRECYCRLQCTSTKEGEEYRQGVTPLHLLQYSFVLFFVEL